MANFRLLSLSRFLPLLVVICTSVSLEEDEFEWPLYMPTAGSTTLKHNDYRCRASKLPPADNYIVSYDPQADPTVAHHMLVFGCKVLKHGYHDSSSWSCKSSTVCGPLDFPRVVYAWALNASGFQLPPGVGQKVGPGNDINYLVVQIHYGLEAAKVVAKDSLALTVRMTHLSQERVSGVFLLGSSSPIPAGKKDATANTACKFRGPKTIVPIAFRTHAHAHSTLIVGYVGDGRRNWREIGSHSPQDPQAFYPVTDNSISVKPGDWLASRCVYNTEGRSHSIHMGPDSEDEMCNFYIMYHTENDGRSLATDDCWSAATKSIHFPPLPVLPTSHHMGSDDHEHTHSHPIEDEHPTPIDEHPTPIDEHPTLIDTHPTPVDITTSSKLPGGSDEGKDGSETKEEVDDYICPSSVPPVGTSSSPCVRTTPTARPVTPTVPGEKGEGEADSGSMFPDGEFDMVPAKDWPFNGVDQPRVDAETGRGGALGQVASVAVDAEGNVLVLHRGPRVWDSNTFSYSNIFVDAEAGPIATPTLITFSSKGVFLQTWGAGLFYLPHSLTVDPNGNIWVTDVALHQVFKFADIERNEPLLTLGHKLTPDSKIGYFCKPADVAVSTSGIFYVADGYCNSRIVSYHANGVIKEILGNIPIDNQMLFVPHSLALDADEHLLYVADRENQRIVSIETLNGKVRVFSGVFGLGRVFGLGFSGVGEGGWPLMTISETDSGERGYGVALGAGGGIELLWGTSQKFTKIHDLAVDSGSKAIYVTELDPPRIWKFVPVAANSTPTDQPSATTGPPTDQTSATTGHPTDISTTTTDQTSTTTGPPTDQTSATTRPPTDQTSATTHPPTDRTSATTVPPTDQTSATTGPPTDQTSATTGRPTDHPSATTGPTDQSSATTGHPTDISTTTTDQTSTTTGHPTDQPTTKTDHPTDQSSTAADHPTTAPSTTTNTLDATSKNNNILGSGSATNPDQESSSDNSEIPAEMEIDSTSKGSHKSEADKVTTPVYHYGLFAAIFAIVGLILVVVIGILKEHRYCFRPKTLPQVVGERKPKTSRDALHSLLGPSKLGFSRLRTYDSDSEVEEFPIFSRQT